MASRKLELPDFPQLIHRFLYNQIFPNACIPASQVSIDACPVFEGNISIFYSACAIFHAPSDPSGPCSMRQEYIQATPSWQKGCAQYDCIFISLQPELPGMQGLGVACVFLFFSITHWNTCYPCVLIQWFSLIGDEPDNETGF